MKGNITSDITVILTVWKRSSLKEQINCILNQTILPKEIWIIQCCDYVQINIPKIENIVINYIHSSSNLGYFVRFNLPLLCNTPYIYILDDDGIPSPSWMETALLICKEQNSIVSSSGRIIPKGNYEPELLTSESHGETYFIGDGIDGSTNICKSDTIVDFGCNSWFIKTEWLQFFWSIPPFTMETAEDIHLSASCKIKQGIKTIIPRQDGHNICGNLKRNYGYDEYASWLRKDFIPKRRKVLENFINDLKWKPINW